MTTPGLEQLAEHVDRLPSLPEVVNHLTRSLGDERADVDTLVYHVNSDPAIVARLLSAANSVASGLATRVTSTRQAFLLLGVDRIVTMRWIYPKSLATSADQWVTATVRSLTMFDIEGPA